MLLIVFYRVPEPSRTTKRIQQRVSKPFVQPDDVGLLNVLKSISLPTKSSKQTNTASEICYSILTMRMQEEDKKSTTEAVATAVADWQVFLRAVPEMDVLLLKLHEGHRGRTRLSWCYVYRCKFSLLFWWWKRQSLSCPPWRWLFW